MKNNNIKITDISGKVYEYEVLANFKWTKTNKYYVIYTDNQVKNDKLQISASIYNQKEPGKLYPIETEEEWQEIDRILKERVINNG